MILPNSPMRSSLDWITRSENIFEVSNCSADQALYLSKAGEWSFYKHALGKVSRFENNNLQGKIKQVDVGDSSIVDIDEVPDLLSPIALLNDSDQLLVPTTNGEINRSGNR
jgi:hypothetical protein